VTAPSPRLLVSPGFDDYALIDSGYGRKLERFGKIIVDRPEPQALWTPHNKAQWRDAHAAFSASSEDEEKGRWRYDRDVPAEWPLSLSGGVLAGGPKAKVICRMQGLWHLGLFPEQAPHWAFMLDAIKRVKAAGETPRVLNLFGYTGAATLLAAAAGAEVVHVDASKKAVAWGRENQALSKLDAAPIRWIVDDAPKFLAREVRRNRTYHVILCDPPKFGRGPDGEVWDLFRDLPPLLDSIAGVLAAERSALVLTVYAIRASSVSFWQLVRERLEARVTELEFGELAMAENGAGQRLLPTSHYVRCMSAGMPLQQLPPATI
jgi:23S rRNA (cytosine1962-C5)-methyltransferase